MKRLFFCFLIITLLAQLVSAQETGSEPVAPPPAEEVLPTELAVPVEPEVPAEQGEMVDKASFDALRTKLDEALGSIASLEADRAELSDALVSRELELAELNALLVQSENKNVELESIIGQLTTARDEWQQRADDLTAIVASLTAERDELDARLKAERGGLATNLATNPWEFDRTLFGKTVQRGFSGAQKITGNWIFKGETVYQTDGSQYFAKMRILLEQQGKRTLYSFIAKSSGKNWVGFGLHFFVSGAVSRNNYGEGKSLLVWLTRDLKGIGDNDSYLQLYRSDDYVNMERVFDAEVLADLSESHKVEILYDPEAEYVLVALDGSVRAVYKTFFGIDEGLSVAFRTLGQGCEFSDFMVQVGK